MRKLSTCVCTHTAPGRQKPQMTYHKGSGNQFSCYLELEQILFRRTAETEPLTTLGLIHLYNTSVSIHPHPSLLEDGSGIDKRHPPQEEAGVPFQNANLTTESSAQHLRIKSLLPNKKKSKSWRVSQPCFQPHGLILPVDWRPPSQYLGMYPYWK